MAPRRWRVDASWRSFVTMRLQTFMLLASCAAAVELRGMISNIAKHRPARQSSTAQLVGADSNAELAVDGNIGQHMFYHGCAMTRVQDAPWWRVDLGIRTPLLVVRFFARNDDIENVAMKGIEIRVGDVDEIGKAQACASNVSLWLRGPTIVNCLGQGRYVFIWVPNLKAGRLALCEVNVLPRGPKEVFEWMTATGHNFEIDIKGKSMHPSDRIRIIAYTQLCGSASAINMHPDVVVRSAPTGPRDEGDEDEDVWKNVKVLVRGFYKVCWCTGMGRGCETGEDFSFVAGYLIVTGELRTVVGDGREITADGQAPELMGDVRVGNVSGLAFRNGAATLVYSEPHRVRSVALMTGMVTTLVGSLTPKICAVAADCGDGGNGSMASLKLPAGMDACDSSMTEDAKLLIADSGNNRIRSYDWETEIVTTVAGSGVKGWYGDGKHPLNASLNSPMGVACDYWRNGFWISDTGSNAIRGAFKNQFGQERILTAAGALGDGLATEGGWSTRCMIKSPQQIDMSSQSYRPDITLTFAEQGNSVARFVPMTNMNTAGNIQTVVGTGHAGYLLGTENGYRVVNMNGTEGVAIHESVAYVSDTNNHRIWMVPILEYRGLGCFKEKASDPLLPLLEGVTKAGLPEEPAERNFQTGLSTRHNAVRECAAAALRMGYTTFGVRDGGKCGSHLQGSSRYRLEGWGRNCLNGIGSPDANDVYELLPGMTADLYNKYYAIAGRAFSTALNYQVEKPRPGFFGDGLSSWISAVNYPGHLAIDKATNNLFFADKGNYRIRVLFGSFGPRPYNQGFRCLNGLPCALNISGNALTQFDSIAFLRIVNGDSDGVVCGNDVFDVQFPQISKRAEYDTVFLRKIFALGKVSLLTAGQFKICYCVYDGGRHCNEDAMFDFVAGSLTVYGPNVLQHLTVVAGVAFDLEVFGLELSSDDRLRLILASNECGSASDETADNPTYYSVLPYLGGPPTDGGSTTEAWRGMVVKHAIELAVCWCNQGIYCQNNTDFTVRTMELHVTGPSVTNYSVSTGSSFKLLLRGTGGFKVTDRVRLQPAGTLCEYNSPPADAALDAVLPWYAMPCSMSATFVQWCDVVVSQPAELLVCWCGSTGCSQKEDFNVLAARLSVTGAAVTGAVSGPFHNATPPVPPLNIHSAWPQPYIMEMERVVTVRAQTRLSVRGANSAGPIDVFVCENPQKCMGPARLFNLQAGLEAQADFVSSLSDLPMNPCAILVRSRSSDAWLAESIDVSVNYLWRRFPMNRWFVSFSDVSAGSGWFPWTDEMNPPRALPPIREVYSEGDNCGGCPLGFECRAFNETKSNCVALCGDGMLVDDEQCDDGNVQGLDGCNAQCRVEDGFECLTEHGSKASVCRPQTCPGNAGLDEYDAICGTSGANADTGSTKVVSCWRRDADFCRSGGSALWLPYESAASLVCPSCEWWMTSDSWLCSQVEAHPQAVFAATIDDGRGLIVAFDVPLNTTLGNATECDDIFNTTTSGLFGDSASCQWASSRHLIVQFGFGADFGLPDYRPVSVDILDSARQHTNVTVPIAEPWKFPSQAFTLPSFSDAVTPEVPVVILRGTPLVGTCGNVTVDASSSRGSLGRPWVRAKWSCLGPSCNEVETYFPQCPGRGLNAALDQGARACDLVVSLPESLAETLAANSVVVTLRLELENVAGASSIGYQTLRFTKKRVPLVMPLSDPVMVVAPTATFSLEVAARAALPASIQSPCSFEEPLGPLEISWRVSESDITNSDLDAEFGSLMKPPATMSAATAVGALSGVLGPLASPGVSWLFVVRVMHNTSTSSSAAAAAVYSIFNVTVANVTAAKVSLNAPEKVSNACPFQAVASVHGPEHPEATFKWKCTRTDFVPGTPPGYQLCSTAAADAAESDRVLSLSSLPAGVYRLEVMYGHQASEIDRSKASALVVVSSGGGPTVEILEPVVAASKSLSVEQLDETFLFRAKLTGLDDGNCAPSATYGAVLLIGLAAHSAVPIVVDVRVLQTDLTFGTSSASGSVIAAVPLADLAAGAAYRFQLLLASSSAVLSAHVDLVSSNDELSMPTSSKVPPGIWSYESAPVTRALPTLFEAWVEPRSGVAARTLFLLQVRALRDGCDISYRFAWAQEGVSDDSCDIAVSDWQMLRPWSSYPDARVPFLAGHFVVEARVRSADGSIARKCVVIDVSTTGPNAALAAETNATTAGALVANWVSDVSPAVNTIRAGGTPESLVLALHAVALEFPDMTNFVQRFGENSTTVVAPLLLKLFDNVCSTIAETIGLLDAFAFTPPHYSTAAAQGRLLQGATTSPAYHLDAAVNALYRMTRGLEPLLTLAQLTEALTVLQALIDRNAAVRGLMGSPAGSGTPSPVAPDFLGVAGIIVNVANRSSVGSPANYLNAAGIVSSTAETVRRLGDAVAAALPLDAAGAPVKIVASGGGISLSVRHLSGTALEFAGISVDLPTHRVELSAYPGMIIPAMGQQFEALKANLSEASGAVCLGSGITSPLQSAALVVIFWQQDIHAIGKIGGAPPEGIVVTAVYDVAVRSCGLPVLLQEEEDSTASNDVTFELEEEFTVGRRAGYGDVDPFRCVQWARSPSLGTELWLDDGCKPVFRGMYETVAASNPAFNLPEGTVRCECNSLRPTTWGIRVVPRPLFVDTPPLENKSFINLVLYGCMLIWVVALLLLCWAGLGDVALDLGRDEVAERVVGVLHSMPDSGASGAALTSLSGMHWPLRSGLSQQVLAFQILMRELCKGAASDWRSLEVVELQRQRLQGKSRPAVSKSKVAPRDNNEVNKEDNRHKFQIHVEAPEQALPIKDTAPQAREQVATSDQRQLEVRKQEVQQTRQQAARPAATAAFQAAASRTAADRANERAAANLAATRLPAAPAEGNPAYMPASMLEVEDKPSREEFLDFVNRGLEDAPPRQNRGADAADWDSRLREEIAQRNRELATPIPRGIPEEFARANYGNSAQAVAPPSYGESSPRPPAAPLPEGWLHQVSKSNGATYYVNLFNGKSSWSRPALPAVQVLSTAEIKALLGSSADGVNLRKDLEEKLRARLVERELPAERDQDDDIWGLSPSKKRDVSPAVRGKNSDDVSPDGRSPVDTVRDIPRLQLQKDAQHWAAPLDDFGQVGWFLPGGVCDMDEIEPRSQYKPSEVPQTSAPTCSSRAEASADLMPARPCPVLMPQALHGAPPGYSTGNGTLAIATNPTGGPRQAGQAYANEVTEALADIEGLPLRLAFADWGYCKLVWHCWVRNFPILSVMMPRLRLPRVFRAASWFLWLSAVMLLSTGVSSACAWDTLSEDIVASSRSLGDLFEELGSAFALPSTAPLGLGCYVVAAWVVAFASSPPPLAPMGDGTKWMVIWWHTARRHKFVNTSIMLALSLVFNGGALFLAAASPQPRAAVALAAFLVAFGVDVVLKPLVAAMATAFVLRWASKRNSSRCDVFLTQRPSVMDFSHVFVRWRSRNQLLEHVKALAFERRACLASQGQKQKSQQPSPQSSSQRREGQAEPEPKYPQLQLPGSTGGHYS